MTGRLLVVRLSAMGDIIHALPAITALRAANPDLYIGWLVEERWAELLCARDADHVAERSATKPLVDAMHIANFKTWRRALRSSKSWREMKTLRDEVRNTKYDLALDLARCYSFGIRGTSQRCVHACRFIAAAREACDDVLYPAS